MNRGELAHPGLPQQNSGQLKSKGFAFKKLPPEIRMQIYTACLQLDRPVMLKSDKNEISNSAVKYHLDNCVHGEHTTVNLPDDDARGSKYIRTVHYCTNRFSKVTARLGSPPSVLNLLLVDKQITIEATGIFYQKNQFHFPSVHELIRAVTSMGINRARAIEHVCFRFTSCRTTDMFPKLHRLVPNLRRLDLLMDFDSTLVHLNKRGLKSARGMAALRSSIRTLTVLKIAGRDRVQIVQDDGSTVERVVDANHNQAVGPWLRDELLSEEGKILLGL